MKKKKTPVPEHVIRAMRRDDGYIIAEWELDEVQFVVYILTADGYKPLCNVSALDVARLYNDGYIEPTGGGKWQLCEKLPIDGEEHKL